MFFTLVLLFLANVFLLMIAKSILFTNLKDKIADDMISIKNITMTTLKYNESEAGSGELVISVNTLQNIYNGIKGYVAFYDSEGNVIDFKGEIANKTTISNLLSESMNNKSLLNYFNEKGLIATYVYPIYLEGDYQFTLVVQEDYFSEYQQLNATISKIYTVQIALFVFLSIVLNSLINKIVQPLNNLNKTMKSYGEGLRVEDIKIYSNDEVGEVTQTFNNMKQEKDKLELVSREFFNNATHELKTPVTSIYSYLQILSENDYASIDEEFRNRAFGRMSLECLKLKDLVQKLLDVSRGSINTNKDKELVNISEIIEDVADSLSIRCDRAHREIHLNLLDISVYLVKQDMEQIILNLLDNAIKYSASNDIYVYLNTYNNTEGTMELIFKNKINDIPDNIKNKLLEPFIKFSNIKQSDVTEISSSGLGLYLCANLAATNGMDFSYDIQNDEIIFKVIIK